MKKITIPIAGMHCRSCELILEKTIKTIENVASITASEKKWIIEITYETHEPDMREIERVILENDYTIGEKKNLPWITSNTNDYSNILIAIGIVLVLSMVFGRVSWSLWTIGSNSAPTIGIAFLIGLTAWVSSCMALIGWLILGVSSSWNKRHEESSLGTKLIPHIFFHLGRILGFSFLWGMLGFFWSIIQLSNIFLGIMTLIVGIIMLILGLNLTNLSPRLGSFSPTLPKFFGKKIEWKWHSEASIFLTGVATFFLPCWFTLAMQVYAISTGSFLTGALILGFFALGTTPWLLTLWMISAFLKWKWLKRFSVFTGVIILGLALFNLNNGYALLSLGSGSKIIQENIPKGTPTGNEEIEEISMTQDGQWYTPKILTISAGKKIRWIITGKNPYSCSSQIMVPKLGISENLREGENIIEFVAPESGEIPFSCSMWMYRWKFIVQ